MKHHDDSCLNHSLSKMDDDINWNRNRQQKIRRNVLSSIDEENPAISLGIKYWIRKTAAPVLATLLLILVSTPLFLSELNDQSPSSQGPAGSGNQNDQGFQFYVDDQTEKKIKDIKESGFDLRLPGYTLGNHLEITNVVKRPAGSGSHVSVTFNQDDDALFKYWQESFNSDDRVRVDQRIEQIKTKASEQLSIGGHNAYIVNENKEEALYILTEKYGFTIHSSALTKDEMINVAQSIDLSNLN